MTPQRLDVLAWVLLYAGLLALALGVWLLEGDARGAWFVAAGTLLAACGVLAIARRSRMHDRSRHDETRP